MTKSGMNKLSQGQSSSMSILVEKYVVEQLVGTQYKRTDIVSESVLLISEDVVNMSAEPVPGVQTMVEIATSVKLSSSVSQVVEETVDATTCKDLIVFTSKSPELEILEEFSMDNIINSMTGIYGMLSQVKTDQELISEQCKGKGVEGIEQSNKDVNNMFIQLEYVKKS